jgi:hypothetical protein
MPQNTAEQTPADDASQSQRDENTTQSAAEQRTSEGETIRDPVAYNASHEAAKARVRLREREAELQDTIDKLEAAEEQRRRDALDEETRLKEDLQTATSRADANDVFREAFIETLGRRIEDIPETDRHRVPDFDDPRKTMSWLDDNRDLFERENRAPDTDAGASGDRRQAARELTAEQKEVARQFGITDEEYAEMLLKAAPPPS